MFWYHAVAFDDDGAACAKAGAFAQLAEDAWVPIPSPADVILAGPQEVMAGIVFYSDFSPQALVALGTYRGAINEASPSIFMRVCEAGNFDPLAQVAYEGDHVLTGSICSVTDPVTGAETIVMICDMSGRGYINNADAVNW